MARLSERFSTRGYRPAVTVAVADTSHPYHRRCMSGRAQYVDVDLGDWYVYDLEQAGSKPGKLWMVPPDDPDGRWLWKPRTEQRHSDETFWKGDDWAEKIVTEIATHLGVPVAPVDLAHRGAELGIISQSVTGGRDLALENQVLADHLPDYRSDAKTDRDRYTVAAVFEALTGIGARAPNDDESDPRSVFASFLVLDALVGNTDRHHENWGVLVGPSAAAPPVLAASFDHASSLGFQLSDSRRAALVEAGDGEQALDDYAKRGISRHFAGKPLLLDLAAEAVRAAGGASCIDALQDLQVSDIEEVVAAVPTDRMSLPARTFVVRLLTENLRRLLDEFDLTR